MLTFPYARRRQAMVNDIRDMLVTSSIWAISLLWLVPTLG